MATIRYTHGFNLLHQVIVGWGVILIGGFGLAAAAISILEPVWNSISKDFPNGVRTPIEWIACVGIWIGCLYLLFKAIVCPLSPLPTWLYLRLCLFVPATWQDAKDTGFLFEGDSSGKWYPFTALRKVPRQFRREVLHEFAEQVRFGTYGIPQRRRDRQPQHPPRQEPASTIPKVDPRLAQARKVLGVTAQSSAEELKKAYRQLIKKYHPDIYTRSQPELQHFAHEKSKQLNEAYELLVATKNGNGNHL
ncbi:MAG: Chaperone protein DnaJ [Verrucomicrobia bacterium ADurb.Bin122]|nr:MAG: Chaperone protein DnaJ [Verrucomicrobia bacterium ADurb.Bin122]